MELPPEDKTQENFEQGMVGQLNVLMYGKASCPSIYMGLGLPRGRLAGVCFNIAKEILKR